MADVYIATTGNDTTGTGTSGNPYRTMSKAASLVTPGNAVFVKGTAGNAASYPTTGLDYTETAYMQGATAALADGTAAAGYVRFLADPAGPTPTIGGAGMLFYNTTMLWLEGLYLVATATTFANLGLVNIAAAGKVVGCTVNTNAQSGMVGVRVAAGGSAVIQGNEFYGGSASPSASAGAYLIHLDGYSGRVIGNTIRKGAAQGVYESGSGATIQDNLIVGCLGNGVETANTSQAFTSLVARNTIDGNGGHGVSVTGTAGIAAVAILDNLITNHAAGTGIAVTSGAQALNDARRLLVRANNLYGNLANYSNLSAGAGDTAVNPAYAGTGDYTPGTTQAAVPGLFPGTATTSHGVVGAVQPAAGGGTTGVLTNSLNGGLL